MLLPDVDFRFVRSLVRLSATVILAACAADPVAPTRAPDFAPAFAKAAASGGPAVNSTLPSSGDKGQTLDVHVFGSGFADGAAAEWALQGVADPTKVRTNKTTFVSSTEVIANITISSSATIAYWDVRVKSGGKTGVGTELFEVTTAIPLFTGSGTGTSVNDQGDIAGSYNLAPTVLHAFVISGTDGTRSDLGLQQARGISADGLVVAGGIGPQLGQSPPAVWTRTAGGAWPSAGTRLPDPPGVTAIGGLAHGIATLAAEGVTVIIGVPAGNGVYWQSNDGTWTSLPHLLPTPAGYRSNSNGPEAIAATSGDIVGSVADAAGNAVPVIWRRVAGSYVPDVLPLPTGYPIGVARGVSPNGTIMVGNVRQSVKGKQVIAPAAWTRNAINGTYTVNLLPTLSGTYSTDGKALGVTVVGTQVRAVGMSPSSTNQTFLHPVLWTWTAGATDFAVRDLGGLGSKSDATANAINPSGTIAVGSSGTAVKWILQ